MLGARPRATGGETLEAADEPADEKVEATSGGDDVDTAAVKLRLADDEDERAVELSVDVLDADGGLRVRVVVVVGGLAMLEVVVVHDLKSALVVGSPATIRDSTIDEPVERDDLARKSCSFCRFFSFILNISSIGHSHFLTLDIGASTSSYI